MSGLAMDADEQITIKDIFKDLDVTGEREPAEYFLQFLWRDWSSKFDIIGPHFPSVKSITAAFMHGCLLDALHAFQMYKFMVSTGTTGTTRPIHAVFSVSSLPVPYQSQHFPISAIPQFSQIATKHSTIVMCSQLFPNLICSIFFRLHLWFLMVPAQI
jgi:hypothetical protein